MKMLYAPAKGTILICNYKNLIAPEMDKLRPVIMISSVSPKLAIVVPLSTARPNRDMPWHYRLTLQEPITDYFSKLECWAKCDMVMAVSFDRLSLPMSGIDHGKRQYKTLKISDADLESIKAAVWRAMSS